MSVFTITFCDRGENHVGNQQIGDLREKGFTFEELFEISGVLQTLGIQVELYNLRGLIQETTNENAGLLIARNFLNLTKTDNPCELFDRELSSLEYDKRAKMYGRVVNKHARHNLVFADFDQSANYELGQGTIVNFNRLQNISWIRQVLPYLSQNETTKAKLSNLVAEVNHYYDVKKCYIGYHSDLERKIVVGLRIGETFPLKYQWYLNNEKIGNKFEISLNSGDVYIMDEKTCGFDGKQRKIPVLRHAAGFEETLKKYSKKS